ncbi:MAG TPA: hypothetical protein VMC79_00135 [Rectinemataceae bacterium]|nr:hypothetical protein [Rectinemataceae bacterium]
MPTASNERGSMRRGEATLFLDASPTSVLALEDFVDALEFLSRRERDRLKLAGDEILDNLIRHSAPLQGAGIAVRAARRGDRIFLGFFFRSPGFASFAARCADPLPLFDPTNRRWRGIGMVMCRNLAESISLRPGSLVDRIFMVFLPETDTKESSPWRQDGWVHRVRCRGGPSSATLVGK